MTWLLVGYLRFERPATFGEALAGGLAFLLTAATVFTVPYVVPREWRALDVAYRASAESSRRRREAFGDGSVPATPRQARAWLARHPHDDPESRAARAWAFMVLGDLEAARRTVERMAGDDPTDRYRRAVSESLVRLAEGADPGLDGLRDAAAGLDAAGRRQAEVDVALLEAQRVAGEGGDWRAELLAIRPTLGAGAPTRVLLRLWLPSVAMLAIGAAAMTAVAYLFSAIVA